MAVLAAFVVAVAVVIAFLLGYLSWLIALPAIGIVVAISIGFLVQGKRGLP